MQRGLEPQMPVDHLAGALGDDWDSKSKFLDGTGHLLDDVVVLARVASVRNEFAHWPVLQFDVLHRGSLKGVLIRHRAYRASSSSA